MTKSQKVTENIEVEAERGWRETEDGTQSQSIARRGIKSAQHRPCIDLLQKNTPATKQRKCQYRQGYDKYEEGKEA